MVWRKLAISSSDLSLSSTLRNGQSFRWSRLGDVWCCSLRGRIIQLTQDESHLHYRAIFPDDSIADDTKELVEHYLNLQPNLQDLYSQWSEADANFRKKAPAFTGVRILRQDAWETLVGFICSSNNNIIRISQMMDKLCRHYGTLIGTYDGRPYYDFPPPQALTGKSVEAHLRELGFGYRARYVHKTAVTIAHERPPGWLDSLRNPESPVFGCKPMPAGEMKPEGRDGYREAHEQLLELQGVGPKVADCVCLMGLGWGESVPIDTHIWQIAQRDYKLNKTKHQSLTKASYDTVANHFRKLWGKEAGWAHSVLFTADLRAFAEQLNAKLEVKVEANGLAQGPQIVETVLVRRARLKREAHETEGPQVLKVDEVATSISERVKRRR